MLTRKHGYTQMKLSYMKDYSHAIERLVIQMDFAWNNRDALSMGDPEVMNRYLENQREELDSLMENLKSYMQPFEEEDNE